jgi:hypothetical protein
MRVIDIKTYGEPIDVPFGMLVPDRTLYDFDGPRIFTANSPFGLLFCYVSADIRGGQIIVATPSSTLSIELLLKGKLTVREALVRDWCWLLRADYNGKVAEAVRANSSLPLDLLPSADTMLYHSLQPILSIKLEGAEIRAENVKASVVRQAIDAGTLAVKRIVDIIWDANTAGRPKNILRYLSDLPTQRFAYGSFQVDFGKPDREQIPLDSASLEQDFLKIGSELDRLIDWASDDTDNLESSLDVQELKALEKLVPPLTGPVESITISGTIFGSERRKVLLRSSTQKLKRAMKAYQSEQMLHTYVGRIGKIDKDALTFELRDVQNGTRSEVSCRFESELFDAVLERLSDDHLVTVTGRQVRGIFEISDLSIYLESKAELDLKKDDQSEG